MSNDAIRGVLFPAAATSDPKSPLMVVPPELHNVAAMAWGFLPARTRFVIAGGALRDADAGRPVKDIDLFVECDTPEGPSPHMLDSVKQAFGPGRWVFTTGNGDYWQAGTCLLVGEFTEWSAAPGLPPVNVIFLTHGTDPAEDAKENDFGLCQVWMGPDGVVLGTEAFFKDRADRTFTLSVCEDQHQFDRSMRRWERLKQKYPDYTLVIPEKFQCYVNSLQD